MSRRCIRPARSRSSRAWSTSVVSGFSTRQSLPASSAARALVEAIGAQVTGRHDPAAVDLGKGAQIIETPAAAANQADADRHDLMTRPLLGYCLGTAWGAGGPVGDQRLARCTPMRRLMSERGQRLARVAALVGVGLIALHNLVGWITFALNRAFEGDFAAYYAFTRIGLHAGFGRLYEVAAQRQEWHALGPLLWYPAVYPPPLAFVVAPFALLPFPVAYAIWNVLLGVAVLVTWRLLAPGSRWQRSMQLGIALALVTLATVGTDGIAAYVSRLQHATGGLAAYQVPDDLTLPGLLGHGVAAAAAQLIVVIGIALAVFLGRARGPQWAIALGVIG